ncbi:MAG TPA: transketolase, partial [Acidimicrobiales bacterium]|nr:transketolase [Acidimicrobiales bacterium]
NRAEAFGWHAIEIDGHDVEAIDAAFAEAVATKGKPSVIIAKTMKGKGVKSVEDQLNAHGKAVPDYEEAIEELGGDRGLTIQVPKPPTDSKPHVFDTGDLEMPVYEKGGDKVSTRKAYGEALAALGSARGNVVALDGEVSNSTFSEIFREAHPDRYFECYIAEQQMIATAVGFQVRGWVPYASTFAAFLSRAYDFIRMGAVSQVRMNICGSHAGVSIGEDGPSQMGLEDIASFRAVLNSTVLYPSDATQTAALVALMADIPKGVAYLRTTRGNTDILYSSDETFEIGGSKVLRSSDDDKVTLVAAGITLHESLKAADALASDGLAVRVIDLYSIKPIDVATLTEAARATEGRVIIVEDHWPEGGIGEAVSSALAEAQLDIPLKLVKLAVAKLPGSAKPDECITAAGIDAESIAGAARKLAG